MYRRVRLAASLAAALPVERRVLARWGWVGEMRSPFEQPDVILMLAANGSLRQFLVIDQVVPHHVSLMSSRLPRSSRTHVV